MRYFNDKRELVEDDCSEFWNDWDYMKSIDDVHHREQKAIRDGIFVLSQIVLDASWKSSKFWSFALGNAVGTFIVVRFFAL